MRFPPSDRAADATAFLSEASTWTPERLIESTWLEHAPFAFWLIEQQRPRIFVELGTHSGFSFTAFCQAIDRLSLATRAYAIDTWQDDKHGGFNSEDVFADLAQYNIQRYSSFSSLVGSTFDEALAHFDEGSIDLLHIDGRHFYDDVKHDFESWRPKLSDRAIVLFHNTGVRERDFGVSRLWSELRRSYPSFEFFHGNGLGVLGVGPRQSDLLTALFSISKLEPDATGVRTMYARLGKSLRDRVDTTRAETGAAQLRARIARLGEQLASSEANVLMAEKRPQFSRHPFSAIWKRLRNIPRDWTRSFRRILRKRKLKQSLARDAATVRASRQFDDAWYLGQYHDVAKARVDPVRHYLQQGAREGRNPSPLFNTEWYIQSNPDVAASYHNPLLHFIRHGAAEGRSPAPLRQQRSQKLPAGPGQPSPGKHGISTEEFVRDPPAPPSHQPVRLIAFYLPQFHPIPENDKWWGRGFTEWTNVSRATPEFEGHYQPHLPADLGFYDLRIPDVQRAQVELAKAAGIGGFCFYFYWFSGKRLLELPLRRYLEHSEFDLPFCLCWANENWTRRWDGLAHDILIGQNHSPEDDFAFIRYVSEYFLDPRYIRVNGKPLLLVYHPRLLPDAKATAERWRDWCRKAGIGEIHLAFTQSFDVCSPLEFGFDTAVEFPPNQSAPRVITNEMDRRRPDFSGVVYDWTSLQKRSASYRDPGYPLWRGVCPSWDNAPRRPGRGVVFANSSPRGYQWWLENACIDTIQRIDDDDERFVFVNAWNEWAEGAHLEPDQRYGHAWLHATRNALENVANRSFTQTTAAKTAVTSPPAPRAYLGRRPPTIVVHAFYLDVFEEILGHLKLLGLPFSLCVTCTSDRTGAVAKLFEDSRLNCQFRVVEVENRGRDIWPFLQALPTLGLTDDDVVLKLHTKKSQHRVDGESWRKGMIDSLLTGDTFAEIVDAFSKDTMLGMVGPDQCLLPLTTYLGSNRSRIEVLLRHAGLTQIDEHRDVFFAGSMFYARYRHLKTVLAIGLQSESFEQETAQVDGTMAHAVERLFTLATLRAGAEVTESSSLLRGLATTPNEDFAFADRVTAIQV